MASGFGTGEYGKLTYGKGVESGSATPITAGFGQAQADIKHTYNAFAQVQAQIKAIGVNKSGQALAQITTRTPNGQAQTWIASVPQLIQEAHSGGISVTFPNTPTPGNLMILFAADRLGDGPTSLSGWTYIGSADWDVNPGGGLSAFYRVVQSGDSATVTSLTANEWVSEWANARYDSYVTQSFQTTHITAGGPITPSLNTAVALAGVVTQAGTGTEDADVRVRLKDQGFPGGNDPYLWVAYKNVLSNASPTTVGTNVSTDPNHPGWGGITISLIGQDTSRGSGQAQAKIIGIGNQSGQAQAFILITVKAGYGQAQVQTTNTRPNAQAQASIKGVSRAFGQSQADIKQTGRGYGQANSSILNRTPNGQAQAWIGQALHVGQAQARITNTYFPHANAQALIKKFKVGIGQAQTYIRKRTFSSGQAQCFITRKQGYGQAQCSVVLHIGSGQAACVVKAKSYGSGQAQAQITVTRGYGQAQCALKHGGSGQAQTLIRLLHVAVGQAQVYIIKNVGFGQAQGAIVATSIGTGQANALVLKSMAYAQAQTDILVHSICSGQAQAFIGHLKVAQAQAFISSKKYLVRYNGYDLPGYAQSEDYNSVVSITDNKPVYVDGSLSEYFGLQNKNINITMLTLSDSLAGAKEMNQLAATMLRSKRGFAKLYIQNYDKYYLAWTKKISIENDAKVNTKHSTYSVEFEAKPWLISDALYEISGTGTIQTTGRTLEDGTWTPCRLIVSGTDITISGVNEYGETTGSIGISGTVDNLIIDTETFTATQNGVSKNSVFTTPDYSLFVGPGVTTFTITGATGCRIQYNNRWLLPTGNVTSLQAIAGSVIVPPVPNVGAGIAQAYILNPRRYSIGNAQVSIHQTLNFASGQANADIASSIKRVSAQAQGFIRPPTTRAFGQAKTAVKAVSRGFGQARVKINTGQTIVTLTSADTAANFLSRVNNLTVDIIELAAGNYTWQNVLIDVDRTSRPLTIRPVAGDVVRFIGPASSSGSIFWLGQNVMTKYITFDGSTGEMWFQDFALAQSGVFEPRGTDHCTFKYLRFSNLSRDISFSDRAEKSWCFYISGEGSGGNDHLTIDHCWFKAPAISRDISAMQIASSGSHGNITITNVQEMTNYAFGFYCERPTTFVTLDTWVMTNTGSSSGPASIDFIGAVNISGIYQNIVATGSDPFRDTHSGGGTITNGGGNSGI